MSLPVDIRAALVANATVASLAGARVYNLRFPQDDTRTAVAFRIEDNVNETTLAGVSVLVNPELRITIRSSSMQDADTLRAAIVSQFNQPEVSINNYSAVAAQVNDLGVDYDDDLDVYHNYLTINLRMRTN